MTFRTKPELLRHRAVLAAIRFGFKELAEDLAQDVMLHWLETGNTHQTIDQALMDVIRVRFGWRGSEKLRVSLALSHATPWEEFDGSAWDEPQGDFERMISVLDERDKAMLRGMFIGDLTLSEVSRKMRVRPTEAKRILKRALAQVEQELEE